MSTHTIIRPAYEGMPTPSAPGFERQAVTCFTCLLTFQVWKWEGARVTLEHQGNGNDHLERHSTRCARCAEFARWETEDRKLGLTPLPIMKCMRHNARGGRTGRQ